jgi:hypothetical protein
VILPPTADAAIELIHRVVGYPLAFVVAPLALATFAGAPGHRWAGKAYVVLMTYLYATGTVLTLTRHEWGSWEFGRNVVFNLLGYSLLLHGFRSMWLRSHPDVPRPAQLDRVLLGVLVALVIAMAALALSASNTPLHVFSAIGIALIAMEIREWRDGLSPRALYRRHVRYMLGSYFYVLTVVSLVHLRDELPSDARWLWPSVLGVATIWLAGEHSRHTSRVMRTVIGGSLLFAVYVGFDLVAN